MVQQLVMLVCMTMAFRHNNVTSIRHVQPHRRGQRPSPLARCVNRPCGHPISTVGEPSPTAAFRFNDVHLRSHFLDKGT